MFCRSGENLKTAVVDKQIKRYGGDTQMCLSFYG